MVNNLEPHMKRLWSREETIGVIERSSISNNCKTLFLVVQDVGQGLWSSGTEVPQCFYQIQSKKVVSFNVSLLINYSFLQLLLLAEVCLYLLNFVYIYV